MSLGKLNELMEYAEKHPRHLTFKQRLKLKNLLLEEIAPYLKKKIGGKQICVSASWSIALLLNSYGILCEPRCVTMLILNKQARDLYFKIFQHELKTGKRNRNIDKKFKLFKEEGIKCGARILQLGDPDDPDDQGHTIIFFEDGSIMDLTIDQASRPKKDIFLKPFWDKRENLSPCIFDIKIIERENLFGIIKFHPEFNEIINHISKKIARILNVKVNEFKVFI